MQLTAKTAQTSHWLVKMGACLLVLASLSGLSAPAHADQAAPPESGNAPQQILQQVTVDTLIGQLDDQQYTSRIIDMAADEEGNIYFIQDSKNRLSTDHSFFYKKISSETGRLQFAPFGDENLNVPGTVKLKPGSIYYDGQNKRMLIGGYKLSEKQTVIKTWEPDPRIVYAAPSRPVEWLEFAAGNLFMMLDDQKAIMTDLSAGTMMIGDASGLRTIASIESGNEYHHRIKALRQEGAVYLFDTQSKLLSVMRDEQEQPLAVKKIDLPAVSAVTVYENAFYLASGMKLYRLTVDGSLTEYFDLANVRYKSGLFGRDQTAGSAPADDFGPLESVDLLAFDHHGNCIVYDDTKRMLRRVNLYAEPAPPEPAPEPVLIPSFPDPEDRILREQKTLDVLAVGLVDPRDQMDAVDLAAGQNGEAIILLAEGQASGSEKTNKRFLKYYDGTTGKTEDLPFDENYHRIVNDPAAPGSVLDIPLDGMIPQKLAYNPLAKELWLGSRYANGKLASFFRVKPEVELKAYHENLPAFDRNDFMVFTQDGRFIYSSVADKKIFIRRLDQLEGHLSGDMQTIPLPFSGGKAVAAVQEGALYVYDSGWRNMYAIELASGNISGRIPVQQSFDHIAGENGLMIGIQGSKVYRLQETGTAEEIADLTTIPANLGIYDPVSRKYRTEEFAPRFIQTVNLLSMDMRGNLYILDKAGNLWRVNLFS